MHELRQQDNLDTFLYGLCTVFIAHKDVPSDQEISFMFELVERREDVHPTIFCSQYSPSEWVTRMGASVKSESITDKFIYDSLLVGFNDFNMRNYLAKQNHKKWC